MKPLGALLVCVFTIATASVAEATTYYVGKSGSDANSCATAQSSTAGDRKLTIAAGVGCLAAGDRLIVGNGTYTESIGPAGFGASAALPSGLSDSVRTVLQAENNRQAIMTGCPSALGTVLWFSSRQYIEVDGIIADGLDTCNGLVTFRDLTADGLPVTYIRIKNSTLRNAEGTSGGTGLIWAGNTTGFDRVDHIEIVSNVISGMDKAEIFSGNHCLYFKVPDSLIERNEISDCFGAGFTSHTTGNPPDPNNTIFRYNLIHDVDSETCFRAATGDNTLFYRNICYDIRDGLGQGLVVTPLLVHLGTPVGVKVYNNTVYGATNTANSCMRIGTATDTILRNNLCFGGANDIITNGGTNSTISNNRCASGCTTSANPLFTNAAANDFTLTATSTMIDAGINVGLPFNGSAPDLGAFETIVFATCSVEDGDASTLRVTFENNVFPPLLPVTGITGFTTRKAGANNPITASTRTGDNRIDFTLTNAIVNGDAVDLSHSGSGNLTDSALIGGTLNQGYKTVLTNQSCTNNVGAAASHTFTQAVYEYHALRGTEAAPVMKPDGLASTGAAENVARMEVAVGGSIRVRFSVLCGTADCPPTGFYPRYSRNGGGYTNVVPDTFGADNIGFCGTSPDADIPHNGTATTNQLSGGTGFVAGAFVRTSNAIPTVDLDHTTNTKVELEYCFTFDTDATAGDTYAIRLYQQDGTALTTYTNTPTITLVGAAGGAGFTQLWDLLMLTMLPMLGRIETQTMKPLSNLTVSYPSLDQILIECPSGTGLKTTGTGTKRTVTCLH